MAALNHAPTAAVDAALAERARNVDRFWQPIHRLGFHVVDEQGARISAPGAAARSPKLGLARSKLPRFDMDRRRGFFTHSVVGNAVLLLTAVDARHPQLNDISIDAICRHPNRHYLANARPIDLSSFVLIRHGTTEANRRNIALGRSNGADDWRGIVIDHSPREPPIEVETWHCSSLLRTEQTAAIFGIHDATRHAALDEMDIGAAEGRLESTVIETFYSAHLMYVLGDPFAAIVDEYNLSNPQPPGECFAALLLRTATCLATEILPQ